MNQEREPKEPAFKVVDKRRFKDDDAKKSEATPSEAEKINTKAEPQEAEKKEPVTNKGPERPQMTFMLFVQSLAHQAMMGLGMVPWPDSGLIKKDKNLAKETIDIIRILREKTVNNLSADENRLIDTILYQLQVAFVEEDKQPDSGKIIHS